MENSSNNTNYFFPFLITFASIVIVFTSCGIRARRRQLLIRRGLIDPNIDDWDWSEGWPPRRMGLRDHAGADGNIWTAKPRLEECWIAPGTTRNTDGGGGGGTPLEDSDTNRWGSDGMQPLSVMPISDDDMLNTEHSAFLANQTGHAVNTNSLPAHATDNSSRSNAPYDPYSDRPFLLRFIPFSRHLTSPLDSPRYPPVTRASPTSTSSVQPISTSTVRSLEKSPISPSTSSPDHICASSFHIAMLIAMPSQTPLSSSEDNGLPELQFGVTTVTLASLT